MIRPNPATPSSPPAATARDAEVDATRAVDVAQQWLRKNHAGTLTSLQYKLEEVRMNGSNTRYIVIVSIVPDVGQERLYYLLKVDVVSGKIVPPIGKGKKDAAGKLQLEELQVDPKWFE